MALLTMGQQGPECLDRDCPLTETSRQVLDLEAEPCEERVRRVDLTAVDEVTDSLGCQDQSPCFMQSLLNQVAGEYGVPASTVYAVAWTENRWRHWTRDGKPVVGISDDIGLFQINVKAWAKEDRRSFFAQYERWEDGVDWDLVRTDPLYNGRVGSAILAWCYRYASRRGYRGQSLSRATYACYNGGPRSVSRPWDPDSKWARNDERYLDNVEKQPWARGIRRGCSGDDACSIQYQLMLAAKTIEVPYDLAFAVAYSESNWRHWTASGHTLTNPNGTRVGVMQLSRGDYGQRDDWTRIELEPEYNVWVGVGRLGECWQSTEGVFEFEDRARAAYACYHDGPEQMSRPVTGRPSGPDRHFQRTWERRAWTPILERCGDTA